MSQNSQNLFIWVDLSIKSMLERLVLKNGVECTSQRLKWTSGARVMTIFWYFIYKWSFSLYLSIGSVLELLVLKNAAQRTSQRVKRTSGARVSFFFFVGRVVFFVYARGGDHFWK